MAPTRGAHSVAYALVLPGIEDLATREIESNGGAFIEALSRFDKRDSLLLFRAVDLAPLLRAGLVEDVFRLLLQAPTPSGPRGPQTLARGLELASLHRALAELHRLRPKRHGRSFRVVARMAGRHPFRREDVERAFTQVVASLLPHWVAAPGAAALEIWVHIVGKRTIVGARLSGDELAQRRYKRQHLVASLKPTAARALVLLAGIEPNDTFIDPMAGAGTILRERLEAGGRRLIAGGDIDPEAASVARQNVGRGSSIAVWDATCLPLADASIDAVVSNPPFGRRHRADAGLDRLYNLALREASRVLRPGGRCVILTGEPDTLVGVLPAALRVRARRTLLLRGLPATAFVMERK